jgi:DNA-binding GntR family transcriptional regulator
VRPQSGTYVLEATSKDYIDLLEVRAYLEGLAYRLALGSASEDAIAELASIVDAMDLVIARAPIDMQRYAELHYSLHYSLVKLAGNELLVQMFGRLNLRASHMFLRSMNAAMAAMTQEEHHRIIRQLRERDPKGERFVIEHLWRKKTNLSHQ